MKKMLCYFLLCAVVLGLIAGCISAPTDITGAKLIPAE